MIDNWRKASFGRRLVNVDWAPGSAHELRLEYFESTGGAWLRLVWDAGVTDDAEGRIAAAVAAARAAEVAIIVAGVEEGEFRGDHDPGGRLPITFPMAEGQLPLYYNHKPTGRGDDYVDLTGMPLFPFGHGRSYTTFEYSDLRIEPAEIPPDGTGEIHATVTNTGTRPGSEVAQLYIRDVLASVARPVQELKGFQRVHLAPGESTEVTFRLAPEHLRMLDAAMQWVVEPGAFRIMVGRSSEDIRLRGELVVR